MEYKDATRVLYDGALPTVHHVNMLLADPVINSLQIEGVESHFTDCRRRPQTIHPCNNEHLLNTSEVSSSITKTGGMRVTRCPLDVGEVVCLSSGKLKCYFLFHAVLMRLDECSPADSAIHSVLKSAFSLANINQCRSISFPALELKQNSIIKIVNTFTEIIINSENKYIEVIKIVGNKKTVFNPYQKAL